MRVDGRGEVVQGTTVAKGPLMLVLSRAGQPELLVELSNRRTQASVFTVPLANVDGLEALPNGGFSFRCPRGLIRFWGADAYDFLNTLRDLKAGRDSEIDEPESRVPGVAKTRSSTSVNHPAAGLRPPSERPASAPAATSPIPWLGIGIAAVVVAALAAQFQIGGITWRWDCEDYAAEKAVEEFVSGSPLKNAYEFTGAWIIGYCRPTYL